MTLRLFSPWRSKYINSFNEKVKSKGCLFCNIAKQKDKDNDNLIVFRGKYSFVVMNRYPYNSGHVMVVPYKHTSQLTKLSDDENREIMYLSGLCIKALEKVSKPHGFNFGANFGKVSGAGIDKHIHFHIVPRWNGDVNFMPVLADVKVVSEETEETCRKLKNVFLDLAKKQKF